MLTSVNSAMEVCKAADEPIAAAQTAEQTGAAAARQLLSSRWGAGSNEDSQSAPLWIRHAGSAALATAVGGRKSVCREHTIDHEMFEAAAAVKLWAMEQQQVLRAAGGRTSIK